MAHNCPPSLWETEARGLQELQNEAGSQSRSTRLTVTVTVSGRWPHCLHPAAEAGGQKGEELERGHSREAEWGDQSLLRTTVPYDHGRSLEVWG